MTKEYNFKVKVLKALKSRLNTLYIWWCRLLLVHSLQNRGGCNQSPCQWEYWAYVSNTKILFTHRICYPFQELTMHHFICSIIFTALFISEFDKDFLNYKEMNKQGKDWNKYILMLIDNFAMNIFKRFLHNNQKSDQYHKNRALKLKTHKVALLKLFDGGLVYYVNEIIHNRKN